MPSRITWLLVALLSFVACARGEGEEKTDDDDSDGDADGSGASTSSFNDATGTGAGFMAGSGGFGGASADCDNVLEVTFRDFSESHPDFEMPFSGDVVRLQLVEPILGPDKRPVFKSGIGCPQDPQNPAACANWTPTQPVITGATTYDQWYHTVEGVNYEFQKTLTLIGAPGGDYVYDSNAFFPLGPAEGFGVTPTGNPQGLNFLFTTELHVEFTYQSGQVFTFRGDDDLWIFVNDRLALDIGSMHVATEGTINFDALAATLGITPGNAYPMDIFHAERHTSESNFRFQTNIECFTPVDVPE